MGGDQSARRGEFCRPAPGGPSRQTALQQAIASWSLTDPPAAATWINQFKPNEDFDQAVVSMATMPSLMKDNVEVSLNWANSIFNESLRTATVSQIISQWNLRDSAAALNYVQTTPDLSPDARGQLLHQLQTNEQ